MERASICDPHDVAGNDSVKTPPPQTYRYVYHFIFANKSGDHVLAEVLPNGVARLPRAELPAGIDYLEPNKEDALERCIESEFGLSVFLSRQLWNGGEKRIEGTNGVEANHLYLGDVLNDKPLVRKPFEWIHRNVASISEWVGTNGEWEEDNIRFQLRLLFGEINGEVPLSEMPPWRNVGWFEKITLWSREVLETKNMVMEDRIRQLSRTGQSAVMTCEVRMGGGVEVHGKGGGHEMIFVKSTLPLVREVERTVTVASVVGDIVPEIIAFRAEEGLFMMRNVGKVTDEAFDQEALIGTILKIQRLSMNRISELEAGGLRVHDSEWVESNVESILNHKLLDDFYGGDSGEYVNEEDKEIVENLRSKTGLIQKKCREITKLGLPRTIVHGDMYELNIGSPVRCEGKVYRIFDWAKSFIGNPLHDFESLLPWQWTGDGIDSRDLSMDLEAGVKQICEQWKACAKLTLEEMKSMFETLRDMSSIVKIHDLTEQYDMCEEEAEGIILRELRDWID